MSWQASEWAKKTRGHRNGSQKKVLLILAEEYREKWGYTWISYEVLADHAEMSKRNLRRHLKNLEADGYIEIHRGTHHTATRFRLRMDQPPVKIPRPTPKPRRKTSPYQRALEPGSQDNFRGVTGDSSGERLEGTAVPPQNAIRGDMHDLPEGTPVSAAGGTRGTVRGDTGDIELSTNYARQPGINPVGVTPVTNSPGLKKRYTEDFCKPLPQPEGNGCRQPGENARSGSHPQSSVFPGVITKGVPETEATEIGASPPNPCVEYQRNIGPLAPMLEAKIRAAEERYGAASIVEAIGIAVEQNSRKWSYVEGILRKWAAEGRSALGEPPDHRSNRKRYLEEYVRVRGHLPWEPTPAAYQGDFDREQDWRRGPPLELDPAADNHWRAVLDALQQQIPKPTFETWLAETCGVYFDDQRFVVDVPTPFAIAWLERRMYQDIQKTVQQVTGKLLDVQFQCSS